MARGKDGGCNKTKGFCGEERGNKMKNKLVDLNDYLFEQLEKINDDELSQEEMEAAIKKAETITKISETIIKNGELQYKAMKAAADYGIINTNQVKLLLGQNKNENQV